LEDPHRRERLQRKHNLEIIYRESWKKRTPGGEGKQEPDTDADRQLDMGKGKRKHNATVLGGGDVRRKAKGIRLQKASFGNHEQGRSTGKTTGCHLSRGEVSDEEERETKRTYRSRMHQW